MTSTNKLVEVEYHSCGLCGSDSYETLCPAPSYMPYANCAIVKCQQCGLVRTNPRPVQAVLADHYNESYYSYQPPDLSGWRMRLKVLALRYRLSWLYARTVPLAIAPNAAVCDVGCGAGQWLATMHLEILALQTLHKGATLLGKGFPFLYPPIRLLMSAKK